LLQAEHKPLDLFGVGRCPENFERVLAQDLNPGGDIRRVLRGVMTEPQLAAQDHAGNFSPQFLPGIPGAAERMRKIPIQPGRVTRPVAQFVQRGRIVSRCSRELGSVRKMNPVGDRLVERPVLRGVDERGAR
jgi:hypothetical protein